MNHFIRSLILLATMCVAVGSRGQGLVINEVMPANLGEALDASWNFGGWIEVYNPLRQKVSLAGLVVADHKGHSFPLTKDHGSVAAGSCRCVWFGHHADKADGKAEYQLQADFKLDCDGGKISLCQGGTVLDEVAYPAAVSRCSWARTTDGGPSWRYCAWPTAGQSNAGAAFADERLSPPQPDCEGGWIDGEKTFGVAVPEGAALYYTTDGSVPTSASLRADLDADGCAHFSVDKNAVFRFRALPKTGVEALPSAVVTRSFITRSFTKIVTDYDDWDGWWHPGNTREENTTFGGFSLLSVVTDPDYLYDDEMGIYTQGVNGGWSYWTYANYYQDWDRPVNVEIFDCEGVPLVNQEVDMSISGGYSRMSDPRSFKLKSDKKFEGTSWYPTPFIFDERPFGRYKDVLVRVGGDGMVSRHQDNALQTLARRSGLYIDSQAFRPVYVFFNGEYQETLLMREPSNKQFGYSNYGMDTDEMDTLEESDITGVTLASGSWDAFNELCEAARQCASDDRQWERVRSLLDVDEYANYFALEIYLANADWPQNNIKMFREHGEDEGGEGTGRFHVVLQDLDACFHETGNTFDRIDQYEYYPYAVAGRRENVMLTLFFNLMKREEFCKRFVDAFCLVAGSTFDPQRVYDGLDRLGDELSSGYVEQNASLVSAFNTLYKQLGASWQDKRVNYLRRWGKASSATQRTLKVGIAAPTETGEGSGVLLNGQPVPYGAFSGTLCQPVVLEAKELVGKAFKGWQRGGVLVTAEHQLQVTTDGTYTPIYEDAPAEERATSPVVINEVSAANAIYHSERLKRSDWFELFNTSDEPADVAGMFVSDDPAAPYKYQIPPREGITVIPPRGHLIVWADDCDQDAEASRGGWRSLHVPFKLANRDYSTVVLSTSDGVVADAFHYHAMKAQQTVGRWPDGGKDVYLMDRPTIAAPNLYTSYARLLEFDPLIVGNEHVATPDGVDAGACFDVLGRRSTGTNQGLRITEKDKRIVR